MGDGAKKAGESAKGFFAEFKDFIMRGNVIDMAIGVVIGTAFGSIVTSFVNDILMPLISLLTGGLDFTEWFVALNGQTYATLEEAQAAGAATLNFGTFISYILNFIIIALFIFLMLKAIFALEAKMSKKKEEEPTTKTCPYCCSEIPIAASRCPNCTSLFKDEAEITAQMDQ